MASSLRPNPYEGSTDVNEFFESFEQYAQFADWADRKKTNALKTMLKDNASRWLSRQNFQDDITYNDLVDQIRLKYQLIQSQIFQLHSKLTSTKQQPHETVDNHAKRTEQLCNSLNIEDPVVTVSECTCQGGNESVTRDGDVSSQYTDKNADTHVLKHLCCATHVLVCNHCNGTSDANSVTCTSTGNEMQT